MKKFSLNVSNYVEKKIRKFLSDGVKDIARHNFEKMVENFENLWPYQQARQTDRKIISQILRKIPKLIDFVRANVMKTSKIQT